MGIFKNVLSTCLVAGLIGTSSFADPAESELCQSSIAVFTAALDAGQPADVDRVLSVLLEGAETEAYLETLNMDQAQPWFAVLFHPEFVNTVVSQDEERKAQWSKLADILEAAYVPTAQAANTAG